MSDNTEQLRTQRIVEINSDEITRESLKKKHGEVYSTSEMTESFDALGFMAPYVVVRRKADGAKGSLEFSHNPRFYFNFQAD